MRSRQPSGHLSRPRWSLAALFLLAVLGLTLPLVVGAQDDETPSTEPEGSAPIISTGTGEVPTTGGRRPGPFDQAPAPLLQRDGIAPIALRIDRAGVDAEVERLKVLDGVMQDPTGPWVVAWYDNLASLGEGGNVVMAGHIDYWNVGPSVFYSIDQLAPGDEIAVTGEDGQVFTYAVEWVRQYDAENVPLDEIVGPTNTESLTLITCGGTFDYTNAQYLQRTVVRASQIAA